MESQVHRKLTAAEEGELVKVTVGDNVSYSLLLLQLFRRAYQQQAAAADLCHIPCFAVVIEPQKACSSQLTKRYSRSV